MIQPPVSSPKIVPRRRLLKGATVFTATIASLGSGLTKAAGMPSLRTAVPGSLTIAMNGDMPMDSLSNGELIGTDGEMVAFIARRLGLRPAAALMDWSATVESVRGGRADIVLGNMGWTAQRSQILLMTDAIYYMGKYVLMQQSAPIGETMTIKELGARSVGVQTGAVSIPELKKVPGVSELKLYDNTDSCVRDVRAGRVDLAILDTPTVTYMLRQNADWGLKLSRLEPDPAYLILGRKQITSMGMNPDNPDLFDAVNAGIAWLWSGRKNEAILAKYGLGNPDNLTALDPSPRLGVDRDDAGIITGKWAHTPKDFSAAFAGNPL